MAPSAISIWVYVCFFLSGMSGLIYEIVWMRKLTLAFGSTVHAVSTVLAVYMGGLALGSWLFGRLADRNTRPLTMYAWIEAGIGLTGAAVMFLLLPVLDRAYIALNAYGLSSGAGLFLARFCLSAAILIAPTALMGATLPVMSRFLVRSGVEVGARVGLLYGLNTLGAVCGSFAAAFWLIGEYGEQFTNLAAVAGNLTVSGVAILMIARLARGRKLAAEIEGAPPRPAGPVHEYREACRKLLPWLYAGAGFTALALEVLWTRALIYFVGLSVHAFSMILICFLAGIALGSLAAGKFADRSRNPLALFGALQGLIALSALASIPLIAALPQLYQKLNLLLGASTWWETIFARFVLCIMVLGIPTLAMGASFPLVNRIFVRGRGGATASGVGLLYAANTLGTIFGSLFAGLVILPLAGIAGSILTVAVINLIIALAAFYLEDSTGRTVRRTALAGLPAAAALAVVWLTVSGSLAPVVRHDLEDSGKEILFVKEGAAASVAVLRNSGGDRELNINGESTAYTGFEDMVIHKLLAHLPILFHPDPKNMLVVGFGLGNTLYTATRYGLQESACVELVPDEVLTAPYFHPENHGVMDSARVKMIFNDGRNVILTSSAKYDIISFNAIHPKLSPALYTHDFYHLCDRALAPRGTICAWLPTNGLSLTEFRSLLLSFMDVFPHCTLWYCNPSNLILLGTREPFKPDYAELRRRMQDPFISRDLAEISLSQPLSFLSLFMMGEQRLGELLKGAPLNTDAHPLVEFSKVMAPVVPLDTYHWLLDNMEPVSACLTWNEPGGADSLSALARDLNYWFEARKTLYRGKFASWVFEEHAVAFELYRRAGIMNSEDQYIQHFLGGASPDPDSLAAAAAAGRNDFTVRFQLANYYNGIGKRQEARRWYREVLAIRPRQADAWFHLGLVEEDLGNPSAAEQAFIRALEVNPASPQILINLGLIRYRAGDLPRAEKYFKRALEVSPDNSNAIFNLGNVALRKGDRAAAESLYRESARRNPFKAEAWINLGAQLTNRGELEEAVDCYSKAINLQPGMIPAYLNLALTFEKLGRTEDAERCRAVAESLSPAGTAQGRGGSR